MLMRGKLFLGALFAGALFGVSGTATVLIEADFIVEVASETFSVNDGQPVVFTISVEPEFVGVVV